MSELSPVVDPDVPAPAPDPAPVAAAPPAEPVQPPEDDDHPDAVDVAPGHRMVPVGALKAVRDELKVAKPLAERALQLQAEADANKPYVDFLRANPHILTPQPAAAPASNEPDPELVTLARNLELYDAATGQPDVKRAKAILDMSDARAERIAQRTIAPLQEGTNEQKAAANLQAMLNVKDAAGRPLEKQYITQAVAPIVESLSKADALRVLADPKVANLIRLTALGIQASTKPAAVAPPADAPLVVESAGGGSGVVMSEDSKKLAKLANIPEDKWTATAKRFNPGRSNVLE